MRQHLFLEFFVYLVSAKMGSVSSVPDLGSTEVSSEAPHPCCCGSYRWRAGSSPLCHCWESQETARISEGCAGHKTFMRFSVVPSGAHLLLGASLALRLH